MIQTTMQVLVVLATVVATTIPEMQAVAVAVASTVNKVLLKLLLMRLVYSHQKSQGHKILALGLNLANLKHD